MISRKTAKQEKLPEEIVRYSENYLRSCINESLYQKISDTDLMEYSVGSIILKKVVNPGVYQRNLSPRRKKAIYEEV